MTASFAGMTRCGCRVRQEAAIARLALSARDASRLLSVLDSLTPDDRSGTLTAMVVSLLTETETKVIRNAAAMALADMQTRSAARAIVDVLRMPATRKSRGTLSYPLARPDGSIDLDIVADTVVNSSFEAGEECMDALERRRIVPRPTGCVEFYIRN